MMRAPKIFETLVSVGFMLVTLTARDAGAATSPKIDFNRDIRPILSENCYTCHGPDANKLKANLRLDVKESAFGKAKSGGIAVVPGAPEKSEMIRRLTATDPDDVMPPAKENKALKPEQVELLTRWIKEGAAWAGHWAFESIRKPQVPQGVRSARYTRRVCHGALAYSAGVIGRQIQSTGVNDVKPWCTRL